jgi:hypothetical protein
MRRYRALGAIAASLLLFAIAGRRSPAGLSYRGLANNQFPELRRAWLQALPEHGYIEGQNLQIRVSVFSRPGRADPIRHQYLDRAVLSLKDAGVPSFLIE